MTTEVFNTFHASLTLARQNLATADQLVKQLLIAHTVTLLESYLQGLVELMIASHDKFLLKLARTKHFESQKLTLVDAIKSNPRQYLLAKIKEFNFHSLGNAEPLLRQAFKIKIVITPELVELIKLRNDVVHRNGHNKAGQAIELTHDVVLAAMRQVEALVSDVDQQAVSLLAEDSPYAG